MTLLPRGTRLVGIRGTRQGCGARGKRISEPRCIDRSCLLTAATRDNHIIVRATLAREPGQAFAEMAVIVAAIAVACLLAALFLGVTIKGLFDRSGSNPATPPVFTPPATTPAPVYPSTLAECENGGWRNFPQFRNERECSDYVRRLQP